MHPLWAVTLPLAEDPMDMLHLFGPRPALVCPDHPGAFVGIACCHELSCLFLALLLFYNKPETHLYTSESQEVALYVMSQMDST